MTMFLLCETCCEPVDLGDTAVLPEGSPHAGHRGLAVEGCADVVEARALLARHLHVRGLARELATSDQQEDR